MRNKQLLTNRLYKLLYSWEILETCDHCQHMTTYRDNDNRHPCAKCQYYEKFKIADNLDADLKDKVKQMINIINQ